MRLDCEPPFLEDQQGTGKHNLTKHQVSVSLEDAFEEVWALQESVRLLTELRCS